ncbi:TonB-dependent receptor plug domain-containing protein [Pseudoalteromonas sp. T1lg65]|uniref:TonB-dependent receptor plug domain-containing protein n=1 Tax=Pseudoalteromonas sp. T1lg65 TaxID=2077101 RepID=UPI003F796993
MNQHTILFCTPVILTFAVFANANEHQDSPSRSYEAAEIRALEVHNGLALLEQLPAFQLQEGSNARGLSSAYGNVLINGTPLLIKSGNLEDYLRQLPSNQITRVDLYSGAHPYSALSQYNQVVNIIRNTSDAELNWRLAFADRQPLDKPDEMTISYSDNWQDWSFNTQLTHNEFQWQSKTLSKLFNANTKLTTVTQDQYIEFDTISEFKFTAAKSLALGKLDWRAFAKHNHWRADFDWQIHNLVDSIRSTEYTHEDAKTKRVEVGLDWSEIPFYQWVGSISGYHQYQRDDLSIQDQEHGDFSPQLSFSRLRRDKESVLRLAFNQPNLNYAPELGIEISYNQTMADALLSTTWQSFRVTETRIEPYAAFTTSLAEQWQLYGKLVLEQANLSSQADTDYQRDHQILKPMLRISGKLTEQLRTSMQLEHTVEQLDFALFLPSRNTSFDRFNMANTRLEPMRYTEFAIQFDGDTMQGHSYRVKPFYQWQRDIHETIALGDGVSGIGNAGKAELFGIETEVTLDINAIYQSLKLDISYRYQHARFNDPVSGNRAITGLTPHEFSLALRYQQSGLAWGIELTAPTTIQNFYLSEVEEERTHWLAELYTEWKITEKLDIRVDITPHKAFNDYHRQYYQGLRDQPKGEYENVRETVPSELSVTLSGSW